MEKQNYQAKMEEQIASLKGTPKLLLHACCAPCSSYVLSLLSKHFLITLFYYNPNITQEKEFEKRYQELEQLIQKIPHQNPIFLIKGEYEPKTFLELAKPYQEEKEGGKRCYLCYKQRLEKTATIAKEEHFDYFTTTLSISPYKKADWINEIGRDLEKTYQVSYLYADFKKKDGYKKSILLSNQYHLYRQDYCGCLYSKKEREEYVKKNQCQKISSHCA